MAGTSSASGSRGTGTYADRVKSSDADKLNIEQCVFVKSTSLPVEKISEFEMCTLCEQGTGFGQMEAAQLMIGGLWRLYPKTKEARVKLLISGITVKGIAVPLLDKNPYLLFDSLTGDEVPSTKVIISNLPLSASNDDLMGAMEALGVQFRSRMRYELARDHNNRLTRFKTGRRLIHISVPDTPLPRKMDVGNFKVEIYHKEQRLVALQANRECYKCLEKGHVATNCENNIKCRDCRKEGHRSGDPACGWVEQAAMFEKQIHQEDNDSLSLSDSLSGAAPDQSEKQDENKEAAATHPEEETFMKEVQSEVQADDIQPENKVKVAPKVAPKAAKKANRPNPLLSRFHFKSKRNREEPEDVNKDENVASKKAAVDTNSLVSPPEAPDYT